eukprot:GEMP01062210.1.p1 GENE.GEMP01062210.1~~GEMP01062210.1.p1  ORF type:complete len:228 (+),score=48.98 GEMP01062210.1:28-684(+)
MSGNAKMKTTDWNNFDVYEALSKLEDDPQEEVRIGSGEAGVHIECSGGEGNAKDKGEIRVDEDLNVAKNEFMQMLQQRLRMAEGLKDEGNEEVRRQRPQEALSSYEQAINCLGQCEQGRLLLGPRITHRLDDILVKLHNNQANVLLQLDQSDDAIHAARASISILPTAKAYFRLGQALERTGNVLDAHQAYVDAGKLAGTGDIAIKKALARTRSPMAT